MRKILRLLLPAILVAVLLTACGDKNESAGENVSADTVGGKYVNTFLNADATDANAMVENLLTNVPDEYGLASMEVEAGFLNGFDGEIQGFTKGVMFSPMIGSIPFVGYVFETDDPDGLEENLKNSANMRWNICTEADELVTAKKGNMVFFMMCTNEEQ